MFASHPHPLFREKSARSLGSLSEVSDDADYESVAEDTLRCIALALFEEHKDGPQEASIVACESVLDVDDAMSWLDCMTLPPLTEACTPKVCFRCVPCVRSPPRLFADVDTIPLRFAVCACASPSGPCRRSLCVRPSVDAWIRVKVTPCVLLGHLEVRELPRSPAYDVIPNPTTGSLHPNRPTHRSNSRRSCATSCGFGTWCSGQASRPCAL